MSIAVIKTGGKQYVVKKEDKLRVEKIVFEEKKAEKNAKTEKSIEFTDLLNGKKVIAEIISEGKEDKIRVYKMRQKARYRRTQGHRQQYSEILIKDIK